MTGLQAPVLTVAGEQFQAAGGLRYTVELREEGSHSLVHTEGSMSSVSNLKPHLLNNEFHELVTALA